MTLEEAIAAGRVSPWAEQRAKQSGTEPAVYRLRVLGEFAAEDSDAVIPLSWLEAANRRWKDLPDFGTFTSLGVDVARFGQDRTVLALRAGPVITELRVSAKEDTMATAGRVRGILGVGAGLADVLREHGYAVRAFNASERLVLLDRSASSASSTAVRPPGERCGSYWTQPLAHCWPSRPTTS